MGWSGRTTEQGIVYLIVFCAFMMLMGTAFGAASVGSLPTTYRETIAARVTVVTDTDDNAQDNLLARAVMGQLRSAVIMTVAAVTVVGSPLVVIILFGRGFVTGFAAGLLAHEFGFGGILLALVSLFPAGIIWIPALVGLGATSLICSLRLATRSYGDRGSLTFLARHFILSAVFIVLLCLAGLVEAVLCPVFVRMTASMMLR